jgi:hypothetical protein
MQNMRLTIDKTVLNSAYEGTATLQCVIFAHEITSVPCDEPACNECYKPKYLLFVDTTEFDERLHTLRGEAGWMAKANKKEFGVEARFDVPDELVTAKEGGKHGRNLRLYHEKATLIFYPIKEYESHRAKYEKDWDLIIENHKLIKGTDDLLSKCGIKIVA